MVACGKLLAATEAHALVMLLASSQVPIVYHGNTFGFDKYMEEIANSVGMGCTSGLLHLTDEWKDAWPIIQLTGKNPTTGFPAIWRPNTPSLKLWFSDTQIKQILEGALSTGVPVEISLEEYLLM